MKTPGSQFSQMQMFVPARDLVDQSKYPSMDIFEAGDETHHSARKIGESRKVGSEDNAWRPQGTGRSLYKSIEAEGVHEPVSLSMEHTDWNKDDKRDISGPLKMHLYDGNHRAEVANAVNTDMEVPVTYKWPDIDTTYKGPLGGTPNWTDQTRLPQQDDPWG